MAADATSHHTGNPLIQFKVQPNDAKREMEIPARDLNIVWGNDSRYWKIPDDDKSPADLIQVYWLEVMTSVDKTDPKKMYEVGFDVSLTADAFGWTSDIPLYLMVKRGKDTKPVWNKVFMNEKGTEHVMITGKTSMVEKSDDLKIYMGLYEVWSGKWKGGLKIHHAFIRELPDPEHT